MPDTPPNILFLMSDEHRPDVAGYAGDSVVRTPTLDWLAETGVQLRNAYTPSPICVPSRQAMMCGQLPRTCGVERFGQDLPPFSMTFAKRLAQHGYATVCCGKLHHSGMDQMQGWTGRPMGDLSVGDWALGESGGADAEALAQFGAPVRGIKWSDTKEVARAGVADGPYQTFDRCATQAALRHIDNTFLSPHYDRPSAHKPLLLKLSLLQPHYPYFTDHERFTYYLNRVKPFLNEPVFDHPFLGQRQVHVPEGCNEREITRATAAYYGMIDQIDTHYAQTLDALRHAGQDLDDWWIIYTTDHGEMLGEHGIWEKQKFFEASARVPLLIRPPASFRRQYGCEGNVIDENVNLCDLFASICEMSGTPLPDAEQTVNGAGLDSRSLLPLLRGEASAGAGWDNETISQFGTTNLMIKRDALKYQRYDRDSCAEQPEVLFDLDAEPGERRNLIGEPAYADAVAGFRARCGALGFGSDADPAYRNAGYARPVVQ